MACARISSPSNWYERDCYYRYQRTLFAWKERAKCESVQHWKRSLGFEMAPRRTFINADDFQTLQPTQKYDTQYGRRRKKRSTKEKGLKTIASQGKIMFEKRLLIWVWVHHSDCITITWTLCCIKSQSIVWFAQWLRHSTVSGQHALFNLPIKHAMPSIGMFDRDGGCDVVDNTGDERPPCGPLRFWTWYQFMDDSSQSEREWSERSGSNNITEVSEHRTLTLFLARAQCWEVPAGRNHYWR